MTAWNAGIRGWQPDFRQANDALGHDAAQLQALRGARIAETWGVGFAEEGDWYADAPVVIRFDSGRQLEVCWWKFDELSLTWDTIDLGVAPDALGESTVEWRRAPHAALESAEGSEVRDVLATTSWISFGGLPGSAVTTGIWFATDRGGLHVFNALDENGLADRLDDADASGRPLPLPTPLRGAVTPRSGPRPRPRRARRR